MQTAILHAQHNSRSHYQLLWRIEGKGQVAPSYLFGTMHLTDKRVFDFSDSVLTALRSTQAFAMEVDMDSLMAYMLSPDGPLLDTINHMRTLLDPDEYHYVDSLVQEKAGVPLERLRLKHLWFLERLLIDEEGALTKNAGAAKKPEYIFLDAWLHQKAAGLNKPVHSLEKMQNQMSIMSDDVSDDQRQAFLFSLGYSNRGAGNAKDRTERLEARVDYLDKLVDLYYEGDLQKIGAMVKEWEESGIEDDLSHGLIPRNLEMVDSLDRLIRKGSVFAAVGVAHLPGEKGLLSLLKEKGYTVTPVNASFTGVTRRERQRLDSLKGYSLNRIADGYSVAMPSVPVAYPIPNINRKMYIGGNDNEMAFAFCMDIPQLATDKQQLVDAMIANMAAQDDGVLERSYPITYRSVPGTEAVLKRQQLPFYIRVFVRNNRAFVFMYNTAAKKDSSSRQEFFQSVRFYDIARPTVVYDTLYRPELGFSVRMPAGANHMEARNTQQKGARPEEAYSALDNANNISYVLRVEKMHRGFYNTSDSALRESLRTIMIGKDSTLQLIDSAVTKQQGLPSHTYVYRHANGYISRLQVISRGNLAYCLLCVYDGASTDSSYWKSFLHSFNILPLRAQAPTAPFVSPDSSFTVSGPADFAAKSVIGNSESALLNVRVYSAMDSSAYAMYIVEVDKYNHYYHNEPDTLLKAFMHMPDTVFSTISSRRYTADGLPTYEAELKSLHAGLRWFVKAVVAGHTIYRLSAIMPEEIAGTKYGQQFLASFHPGSRQKADTFRLPQKKLDMLLKDLQSSDTAVFHRAGNYLDNLMPDSSDVEPIVRALARPFPADTTSYAKLQLLESLNELGNDTVVHAAGLLFAETREIPHRKRVLRFLSGIASDSAIRTLLRLAPQVEEDGDGGNIFSYSFKEDSLYLRYLPAMIDTAAHSANFLGNFIQYTSDDSLWLEPQFTQYNLQRLVPGIQQLFDRQLQHWKSRLPEEENGWKWARDVRNAGHILALPGMPASAATGFRELLADTTMYLRALGARGLMSRGIRVSDKALNSILADAGTGYTFIGTVRQNKQLSKIRHLLNQELLGRAYVGNYLSDEYDVVAIEQVTRVKVQHGDQPAEWLILYRYKTDEDEEWQYVLNGPHPQEAAKLNFEPDLVRWISDSSIVTDKTQLAAEAQRGYEEYLKEQEDIE